MAKALRNGKQETGCSAELALEGASPVSPSQILFNFPLPILAPAGKILLSSFPRSPAGDSPVANFTRVLSRLEEYPSFEEMADLIRDEHPSCRLSIE